MKAQEPNLSAAQSRVREMLLTVHLNGEASKMERLNNPEEQLPAIDIECVNCEIRYESTPENTIAYEYENNQCDHIVTECPGCDTRTRMFIGSDLVEEFNKRNIEIISSDMAPEDIYQQWAQVADVKLPGTHELTDRHEKIIQKFGKALQNIPDEMFWEFINDETGKPYPNKWA